MRKKMVERCEMEYKVDGEVIPIVSNYKYLGCAVDEHLELKEMVEEKAVAGRRALSAWLNRCKTEVGDVGVGIFKKLMSALVDSTMLYGAEIWGCMRRLGNRTSTAACFLHVLWGGDVTSEGIIDNGDGVSTSNVGGKSEVRAVLVRGIDK